MAAKDDGGPAFPATEANGCNSGVWGMSLRDWFAGQAMSGWLADPAVRVADADDARTHAERCYLIADAMLAARSK